MAAPVSKEDYLKRYLSSSSKKKIKKSKISLPTANKVMPKSKIVDDDLDLKALAVHDSDDIELETGEDAPIIVGIVDERPKEIQKMEVFTKSNKWRVLGEEDSSNSPVLNRIKISQPETCFTSSESNIRQVRHDSDSDMSPPRRRHDSDSDASPHVTQNHNSDISHTKQRHTFDRDSLKRSARNGSSSVRSIKQEQRQKLAVEKLVQKSRHQSDSDQSALRVRHQSDSNNGEHRYHRHHRHTDSGQSLTRSSKTMLLSKTEIDSNHSPSAEQGTSHVISRQSHASDCSQKYKKNEASSSADSLKIQEGHDSSRDTSLKKSRYGSDSDQSPPRIKQVGSTMLPSQKHLQNQSEYTYHQHHRYSDRKFRNSDSDNSPPRKRTKAKSPNRCYADRSFHKDQERKKHLSGSSETEVGRKSKLNAPDVPRVDLPSHKSCEQHKKRHGRNNPLVAVIELHQSDSDSSPPRKKCTSDSSKLPDKTLDGKKAGLQDSKTLKIENEAAKKRETLLLEKMGDEFSGRNAKTVLRDRATGQRRNLEEERQQKMKEDTIKAEREAKYMEWGKGLKQKDIQKSRLEDDLHEMSKPLARYKDDEDLDKHLRDQEREGDPMLAFIKKRKKTLPDGKEIPKYSGPQPPSNRFNIWPGYRWDGVDRSNGFEKTRLTRLSNKVAAEEEAYRWSTEDM